MSAAVDFKKTLRSFYNPQQVGLHVVEVPEMNYLMLDGTGDPNTSSKYQQAVEALYSLSYGIKFALKPQGFDHVVPPLEGLWWMDDMNEFTLANKPRWEWTMMIMQPGWVTADTIELVRTKVMKKKSNPLISKARFNPYQKGLAIQILYTGAYVDEAPTIAEMHRYIKDNGYQTNGKHHEIYLGDPRKTPPSKLKTILRQPVRKV